MSGIPVVDVCVPALDRDFDLQKEDCCKRKFRSPRLLASVSVPATSMFQYAWARLSKGGRDAKLGSAAPALQNPAQDTASTPRPLAVTTRMCSKF